MYLDYQDMLELYKQRHGLDKLLSGTELGMVQRFSNQVSKHSHPPHPAHPANGLEGGDGCSERAGEDIAELEAHEDVENSKLTHWHLSDQPSYKSKASRGYGQLGARERGKTAQRRGTQDNLT